MFRGQDVGLIALDYDKYLDSFHHEWTRDMLIHIGVPAHLANMTYDLYTNMDRVIKKGRSLSLPFQAFNGFGQGDVLSLLPALLLVSWQFKVIDKTHPKVEKGAYVDDRNYRGKLEDLLGVCEIVHKFDNLALHNTLDSKTEFLATSKADKTKLMKTVIGGHVPKVPQHIELVGYTISTARKAVCTGANKRADKACETADAISHAPLNAGNRKRAVETKTIPTATYDCNWNRPSVQRAAKLKSKIMNCI